MILQIGHAAQCFGEENAARAWQNVSGSLAVESGQTICTGRNSMSQAPIIPSYGREGEPVVRQFGARQFYGVETKGLWTKGALPRSLKG